MHLNNLFGKKSFDSSWVINQQLLIIDIHWFSITCNETENIDLVLSWIVAGYRVVLTSVEAVPHSEVGLQDSLQIAKELSRTKVALKALRWRHQSYKSSMRTKNCVVQLLALWERLHFSFYLYTLAQHVQMY